MDRPDNEERRVAVTPAPAIGYSVAAVLGDRRNMTVQCFVGEDEADDVVNAKIDRIMRVVDRQQAFYDIEAELEGFHKVGAALQQLIDGLPIAERNYNEQRARLVVEVQAKEDARKSAYSDGYNEHVKRGGRGDYVPKGHVAADLARMDADIAQTQEKITKMPADRAQHRQELVNSIAHYQGDLKKRRAKVNEILDKIGKPQVGDYADAEAYVVVDEAKG